MAVRWLGWVTCAALLFAGRARADFWALDFWQYFENRGLEARVDRDGAPDYLARRPHEWYLASDAAGSRHVMGLAPRWPLLAHLAASRYHQYLGVWHVPAYPVWLRRGRYGLLPPAQAIEHVRRTTGLLSSAGLQGGWFGAYVEPIVEIESGRLRPEDLLDEIKARLAEAWIASNGYTFGRMAGRFAVLDPGVPLVLDRLARRARGSGLSLPVDRLRRLPRADADRLVDALKLFVSRVESLADGAGEELFGAAWDAARDQVLAQGQPEPQYRNRFNMLWRGARAQLQRALREEVGGVFKTADLSRKEGDPRPEGLTGPPLRPFTFRQADLPSLASEEAVGRNAKRYLESLYFSRTDVQAQVFGEWARQLGGRVDPIDHLLDVATWRDNSQRVTLPERIPAMTTKEEAPQPFLVRSAPRTLLVFAGNDKESRTVGRIAERIGEAAGIVPHPLERLRGGKGLTVEDAGPIASAALRSGCKRVVVFELGGMPPAGQALLAEARLEYLGLDHHGNSLDEWQKLSAIEQFFRRYQYQPSLYELGVGAMDRSSVHALRGWGYDRHDVRRFIDATGGIRDLDDLLRRYERLVTTRNGEILVVDDYQGPLGPLTAAMSLLAFPAVPDFLVVEPDTQTFRLSGDSVMMRELLGELTDDPKVSGIYWGGDLNSSLYAGGRSTNRNTRMSRGEALDVTIYEIKLKAKEAKCRGELAGRD